MLEITIWDVGHGNAAYIKTPNNRHVVVDFGDDGEESFSPLRTLRVRGILQLDVAVITHPHRDHLDDIFNIDLLAPRVLITPRHLTDADIQAGNRASDFLTIGRYLDLRNRYTAGLEPANDITVPANFGGAIFQVFRPTECSPRDLNNHSLVVVVSYAGLKMVLPGDNESSSWNELLAQPSFVAAIRGADVFLASHHGREAGYCADLFKVMGKPRLVIISDGRFGDTSATDRYCGQAIGWQVFNIAGVSAERKIVSTRSDGHITIKFGWSNQAERRNYLNVTTTKPDLNEFVAISLGLAPRR